jgi:hypothetical protein
MEMGGTTCGAPIWLTLILNFPSTGVGSFLTALHCTALRCAALHYTVTLYQILIQLVILGWLTMANILQNPFGFNPDYDINLSEVGSNLQLILQ